MSSEVFHHLFIDGKWRRASDDNALSLINPATGEAFGRVCSASVADLDQALASAKRSLSAWSATPACDRGAILLRAAGLLQERLDEAAAALSREQGKTIAEAAGEYRRAVETFEWNGLRAAELSGPISLGERRELRPEPTGIVAAFTPWNYPAIMIARKLAPALAAGCTVILKAAEETPSAGRFIVEALEKAGLPAGVVNLAFGHPPTISEHLLASPAVRLVSFTGSTAVGKQLARLAAANLQRCVLELGGHSPVIVFEDADLDAAAEAISEYKFECAGQSCNAPSRILVARAVHDRLLSRLVDLANAIRIGPPGDPETQMGPMANERRLEAMERLTRDAVERGAKVETGGKRLAQPGFYWPPTILSGVDPEARVLSDEPFGPILTVAPFDTVDEAINLANATEYGLASYVFTKSHEIQRRTTASLSAGAISVNYLKGVAADAPIAGINQSGYGYEGGIEGFRSFQNLKLVNVAPATAG